MPEEYDLSEALQQEEAVSVNEKNRKARKKKIIIVTSFAIVAGAVFTLGLTGWFAPTDFSQKVPLSQDVSRFSSLGWSYGDSDTVLENDFGAWNRATPSSPYTNNELGCSVILASIGGATGDVGTDKGDTALYTKIFETQGSSVLKTKEAYVSVDNKPNGGVEVLKSFYETSDGSPSMAYYRNTVDNGNVLITVVTCKTEESLNKVTPFDGDGSELEKLNISFKA